MQHNYYISASTALNFYLFEISVGKCVIYCLLVQMSEDSSWSNAARGSILIRQVFDNGINKLITFRWTLLVYTYL